jgi:lipoate-protein ligase A
VLLGPGQLFYQLILKRGNPEIPFRIDDAYRKFSVAPIMAYKRLGIAVAYEPVSDLVTKDGRKIAGQGAADIGPCFVYVGNILLDFDPWLMGQCLNVSEETFRVKIHQSMEKNLSWIQKELGVVPERESLEVILAEEFARVLGPMEEEEVSADLWEEADTLGSYFTSEEFVFMETPRRHPTIKVREGTYLRHGVRRVPGGMIRTDVEVEEGKIERLDVTGEFPCFPQNKRFQLAMILRGVEFDFDQVVQKVADFLRDELIECPGIRPEDFGWAIVGDQGKG